MHKNDLLKIIAQTAYNVWFWAKKHFATFDIIEKTPWWLSIISFIFAVLALYIPSISDNKNLAFLLICIWVSSLYIWFYTHQKEQYEKVWKKLTQLFNDLRVLYYEVKNSQNMDFSLELQRIKDIENEYYANSISKQIFASDWYAHYKFFWQHQIDWIDEQLKFKFFKDKIPLSIIIIFFVLIISLLYVSWIIWTIS